MKVAVARTDAVAQRGALMRVGFLPLCQRGEGVLCVQVRLLGEQRDGTMAQWVALPGRNVFPLPEDGCNPLPTRKIGQSLPITKEQGRCHHQ